MRRPRSCLRAIGTLVMLTLLAVAVFGPPVAVELYGAQSPAVVVGKREEITTRRGSWSRHLYLDVRYTLAGVAAQGPVEVGVARYDAAHVGDAVEVRYLDRPDLQPLTLLATGRLVDQGPLGSLRARLAPLGGLALAGGVCALLAAAWRLTGRRWFLAPLVAIVLGGALYVVAGSPVPPPEGPQLATDATATLVSDVARRGRYGLFEPYTIVAFSFVPAGRVDPVVAVDRIDQGSLSELERGVRLPIRYSAADPRYARIVGASRAFGRRNLASLGLVVLIFGALAAFGWYRWKRRQARP